MAKKEDKDKKKENDGVEKPEKEEKDGKEGEKPGGGAEADGAAEGEGGGKKGKLSKKKKLILLVVILVVVIGIAVPAILFLTGKLGKKAVAEGEVAAETSDGSEGGKGAHQAVFYDMEEFVVNLNVGSKRPSFLKMTVSLEVANELQIPTIEKNMPRIRDNFQVYLRELRQDDLQGSAGLYRLREELLLRVNKVVYPAKVNDILFKEILVQ